MINAQQAVKEGDLLGQLAKGARLQHQRQALNGDFLMNASSWQRQAEGLGDLRSAAVALILFPEGDDLRLLLIQRAKGLRHHAAQVGFPGGRREDYDSDYFATAVRETTEEIGLALSAKDLLSPLAPYASSSGFWVQPFVFYLDHLDLATLSLDTMEVESVFSTPVNDLINPACSDLGTFVIDGQRRHWAKFDTKPSALWGLSAGIVTWWLYDCGFDLGLNLVDPGTPKPLADLPIGIAAHDPR